MSSLRIEEFSRCYTRKELRLNARLVSLNVGKPRPLVQHNKSVPSAIVKPPVLESLRLGRTGLEDDAQADLKNHGGPEKAICVYPLEHYPYWTARLEKELEPGAFGENFTTRKLLDRRCASGISTESEALSSR